MSIRENIQIFYQFDIDTYLEILKTAYGAKDHPTQNGCYLLDDLPFYKPKQTDEYVFVLGFNYAPLSGLLIKALASHPELVPDDVSVLWTIEQKLLLDTTMGEIRAKI